MRIIYKRSSTSSCTNLARAHQPLTWEDRCSCKNLCSLLRFWNKFSGLKIITYTCSMCNLWDSDSTGSDSRNYVDDRGHASSRMHDAKRLEEMMMMMMMIQSMSWVLQRRRFYTALSKKDGTAEWSTWVVVALCSKGLLLCITFLAISTNPSYPFISVDMPDHHGAPAADQNKAIRTSTSSWI